MEQNDTHHLFASGLLAIAVSTVVVSATSATQADLLSFFWQENDHNAAGVDYRKQWKDYKPAPPAVSEERVQEVIQILKDEIQEAKSKIQHLDHPEKLAHLFYDAEHVIEYLESGQREAVEWKTGQGFEEALKQLRAIDGAQHKQFKPMPSYKDKYLSLIHI